MGKKYLKKNVYEASQERIKYIFEEFDNIHNLFSAILSRGISYQLKQGLYKE